MRIVPTIQIRLALLAVLVISDILSKALAYWFGDSSSSGAAIGLQLSINEAGLAGGSEWLIRSLHPAPETYLLFVSGSLLAVTAIEFWIWKHQLCRWTRFGLRIAWIGLTFYATEPLAAWLPLPDMSLLQAVMVFRFTALPLLVLGVLVAERLPTVITLVLVLAGACGNVLSFTYPPFRPIDFISFDYPGSGRAVANLADLYVVLGVLAAVATSVWRVASRLLRKLRVWRVSEP